MTFGSGYGSDCQHEMPQIYGNAISNQAGEIKVCGGHELPDWVKSGHDKGSSISKWPADADLITTGLAVLE